MKEEQLEVVSQRSELRIPNAEGWQILLNHAFEIEDAVGFYRKILSELFSEKYKNSRYICCRE